MLCWAGWVRWAELRRTGEVTVVGVVRGERRMETWSLWCIFFFSPPPPLQIPAEMKGGQGCDMSYLEVHCCLVISSIKTGMH
jgi:hypothetical protein